MAFGPRLSPLVETPGRLTNIGLGCAPIGHLFDAVTETDAHATVRAALDLGVRFFDTAPHYGAGLSEQRVGAALRHVPRDTVTVATKVGKRLVDSDGVDVAPGALGDRVVADLSYDGVLRSVESSLLRMELDRIDVAYLHDPLDVDEALGGAFPALERLRDEGVIRAVGVGMNYSEDLVRYVNEATPDVVMIAGRYTLLDRSAADELFPAAIERGVEVIAAGVYNTGILVNPQTSPMYDYRPAPEPIRQRALAMAELCAAAQTRIGASAVQFPLRSAAVSAVVVGARTAAEVEELVANATHPISDTLWAQLGV